MLQSGLSLRQSFIDQHWRKLHQRYIRFSHDCGFKNKNIHLRDFKSVDFSFTHFASFKFPYLEIEESFGLIWVK